MAPWHTPETSLARLFLLFLRKWERGQYCGEEVGRIVVEDCKRGRQGIPSIVG